MTHKKTLEEILKSFDNLSNGQGLHYSCDGMICDCDETVKSFITQALTSQAQVMVDIVEGKRKEAMIEYSQIKEDAKHLDDESEDAFFKRQKVNSERQTKRDVVMVKIKSLDDILTSYKEL